MTQSANDVFKAIGYKRLSRKQSLMGAQFVKKDGQFEFRIRIFASGNCEKSVIKNSKFIGNGLLTDEEYNAYTTFMQEQMEG